VIGPHEVPLSFNASRKYRSFTKTSTSIAHLSSTPSTTSSNHNHNHNIHHFGDFLLPASCSTFLLEYQVSNISLFVVKEVSSSRSLESESS
jgi:hypothetical protein